jgi:hypothetical protein
VGLILYGLLALTMPNVLLDSFSLYVYQFPSDAAVVVDYLSALFRLLGFLNLILGILGLWLLWRYRTSRQTWLVYIIIVSSILSYLGPIVFDNIVGNIGFFEIIEHVIFAAMVLSGITMLSNGRNYELS